VQPNNWRINQALYNYRSCVKVLPTLTMEEVERCLEIEQGTRRRATLIDRLIRRLSVLQTHKLKEQHKWHEHNP